MITLLILVLSICSAIFGRCGGMSHDITAKPTWIPMWARQRWIRPAGCSICAMLPLILTTGWSWWYVPALGALYGALSTYWDWLFNNVDNFWFSGFMCGVAGFFLITLFPWWLIATRCLVLAIGWGILNLLANKNKWQDGNEELARYGFFSLTTIIFLF